MISGVHFFFAVDMVDDAAGSGEAGGGGSGGGVEPAEGEGSMPNGMEIEETKESSQGETMDKQLLSKSQNTSLLNPQWQSVPTSPPFFPSSPSPRDQSSCC